jgi:hypothetical protein
MKVEPECAACLLERGYKEIAKATSDPALRFKATQEILRIISSRFGPSAVPAYLGTLRDRTIKRLTKTDPYRNERHISNQMSMKLLPKYEHIVETRKTGYERFKMACTISTASNVIEFDVLGHNFALDALEDIISTARLTMDHTRKIYNLVKRAESILFLPDNAGEIAFDTLLVKEIQSLGPRVTIAVKDSPILNDATLNDAKEVGMDKVADELMTIGTNSIGLLLDETSPQFRKKLAKSDHLIAKGMAYYETLTEMKFNKPVACLFKAKCFPVAHSVGVAKDSNVALLLRR